jgi:imidazolonepropionase-like amidohydrolase
MRVAVILVLLLQHSVFAAAQTPRRVALVDATVVKVDSGERISDAVVLIEDEHIKSVGRKGSVSVPPGAQVISMQGRWLLPGLMNMHTHFGWKYSAAHRQESGGAQLLRMGQNAQHALLAGVTTVRSVGEPSGYDFALRDSINRGELMGPRYFPAGPFIITGDRREQAVFANGNGPYDFTRLARESISQGATWIKVVVTGGPPLAMTDEELSTVIEVAHRNGVKVAAHTASSAGAEHAMKFGVDSLEHGYTFNEKTLREMQAKGIWYVPTIVVTAPGGEEVFVRHGVPPRPDNLYREEMRWRKPHWEALQTAIKLGVRIALGTDLYPDEPDGGTTATVREAEYYVQAGMTPLQAIQSATTQSACLLGIEQQVGKIEPGMLADIIAVGADPLIDIRALRSISFVMKGGSVARDDWGSGLSTQVLVFK